MSVAIQKAAEGKRAPPNPNTLGGFLELRAEHLAKILPKSSALTPDRLIKLALLATKKNSKLAKCSMDSVFTCLLQCAELGLDPGGSTGEAYLVPYKETCTLIIGFRGYIGLARRSGILKQIETHVAHENDKFKLRFGLDPVLEHEPCLRGEPGQPLIAYCVARLADGATHVEVMTVAEIERIRQTSKAANDGPWVNHWEEMARKTVLRRAAKYLPLSPEMQRAMEIEDDQANNIVDTRLVTKEDAAQALVREEAPPRKQPEPIADADLSPGETVDEQTGEVLTQDAPAPEPAAQTAAQPADPVEAEKQSLRQALGAVKAKSDFKPILDRIRALPASDRAEMEAEYKAASQKVGS